MPGRRRDHRGEAPRQPHGEIVLRVVHRLQVARHDLPEVDEGEPPPLVDHRVDGQHVAQHPHDRHLLLVQRIARQPARQRVRVLHEAGIVERANRIRVCDPRRHHLAPPGVPRHEVRLHQPGGDAHVRLHEPPIQLHRHPPIRRDAEIHMRRIVPRIVIRHRHMVQHPRIADHLRQLVPNIGPMQPRRHQHRDVPRRDPGPHQRLDSRPQQQPVRHRPRNVANQNARRTPPSRKRRQRLTAHRLGQRPPHRSRRIRQHRHRRLANDGHIHPVVEPNGQVPPAV